MYALESGSTPLAARLLSAGANTVNFTEKVIYAFFLDIGSFVADHAQRYLRTDVGQNDGQRRAGGRPGERDVKRD